MTSEYSREFFYKLSSAKFIKTYDKTLRLGISLSLVLRGFMRLLFGQWCKLGLKVMGRLQWWIVSNLGVV